MLPFKIWFAFASTFPRDIPLRQRTYRGLCLDDDSKELEALRSSNALGSEEWRTAATLQAANESYARSRGRDYLPKEIYAPAFFLAALDLAHDTTFRDDDIAKLRQPLSSFLAFLRLDYTHVSDAGISSIARAVGGEDEFYERLEVLSLKGLRGVTDSACRKLAKLPSLRMLELRETSCTDAARTVLNSPPIITSWRPARHRADFREQISLELELFGPSYTPSRILTSLHLLGATSPNLVEKPLLVHLSAIRRAHPSTIPSAAGEEKTTQALYKEQLALTTRNSNATFNATYGAVTSTKRISQGLLALDEMEEAESGNWRSRADGVAQGQYVGVGRTGGRATTMWEAGQRKFVPRAEKEEPLSDWGEESEEAEKEEMAAREMAQAALPEFYRTPGVPRSERKAVVPRTSNLMLLRHFPVRTPYERAVRREEKVEVVERKVVLEEGTSMKRKRALADDGTSALLGGFGKKAPSQASSSSSNSSSPFAAGRPTAAPAAVPRRENPFAKQARKPSVPKAVKPGISAPSFAKLPPKSGLAAFKGRKGGRRRGAVTS